MNDTEYFCPECDRTIQLEETHIDKYTNELAHQVDDGRVSVSHLVIVEESNK